VNVTYACPTCDATARSELDDTTGELICPHCESRLEIAEEAVQGKRICRCLACPSIDLFMRKDFPQRIGVSLVGIGILGSSFAWYHTNLLWTFGILFATALADVLLYAFVGNALMCYRCGAQYQGVEEMESHGQFDLEIHEKYRQLAARLRSSGFSD